MSHINRVLSPSSPPTRPDQAGDRGEPSVSLRSGPRKGGISGVLGGLTALRRGLTPAPVDGSNVRTAIRKGDIQTLLIQLDKHPERITATNSRGDNLLSEAARAGDNRAVSAILRRAFHRPDTASAMLNHRNEKGDTPLILAIAAGRIDVVNTLLERSDVNVALANNKMETPLHLATSQGNVELIKRLMSHPGNAPGLPNKKGETALHLAAAQKDFALVRALADCPAEVVNQANASGRSALTIALQNRNHEVVVELLKHPEIDVNTTNGEGESLLYQAAARKDIESVELLINDPRMRATEGTWNGTHALSLAIERKNANLIRLLCKDATVANAVDRENMQTPLDRAIETDNHALIAVLLESDGVDAERLDLFGRTALHRVVTRIDSLVDKKPAAPADSLRAAMKTLALLLGSDKVNPNTMVHGWTLLAIACRLGRPGLNFSKFDLHADLIGMLMSNGRLDVNQRIFNGETPLEIAVRTYKHEWTSALLADERTDPNVLVPWLLGNPERAYEHLNAQSRSRDRLSPSSETLDRFVEKTLAQWAARGGVCTKGAVHHLSHSLERAIKSVRLLNRDLQPREIRNLKDAAGLLIKHAPADMRYFNVDGVDVSRAEVETWAAGMLPDALVNRQIERGVKLLDTDVHVPGLTSRGSRILTELRNRVPEEARLSMNQCIAGIKAAMNELNLAPERQKRIVKGLKFALRQKEPVEEGLGTNVSEVLLAMWSHIQTFASPPKASAQASAEAQEASSPDVEVAMDEEETKEETDEEKAKREMHGNMLAALFDRFGDIAEEKPCNTGCVQRILYAVDGVDLALTGAEPDQEAIGEEIKSLAAQVNERFETLYGASAVDSEFSLDEASTSSGSPLSDAERQLVAQYQGGLPVDGDLVLMVKQDMLEVRVMTELVERRGWGEKNVKPELEKIKGWMAFV